MIARVAKTQNLVGPLYLQVADALRESLMHGEASKTKPLPSEIDLAEQFKVSIGTMRKALEVLVKERMIERRRGRGTFLISDGEKGSSPAARVFFNNEQMSVPLEFVDFIIDEASTHEARNLFVRPGTELIKITRHGHVANMATIRETLVVQRRIFPDLEIYAASLTGGLHGFYASNYGVMIDNVIETIDAGNADAESAKALGVPVNKPILHLNRFSTDKTGERVEWSRQWLAMDQAQYLMKA